MAADKEGGFSISHLFPGEWFKYRVNVQHPGTYTITTRIAISQGGGSFHYELNDTPITQPIVIPTDSTVAIGNYNYHVNLTTSTTIPLSQGEQVLKLVIDTPSSSGVQLSAIINYFDISLTSSPTYSLDSDTDVDIYDILILISRFTQNLAGDFNQNGRIDIFDFTTLLKNRL